MTTKEVGSKLDEIIETSNGDWNEIEDRVEEFCKKNSYDYDFDGTGPVLRITVIWKEDGKLRYLNRFVD